MERWGKQAFDRLYGDYAFALWDRACRRLILARDGGEGRRSIITAATFVAFASIPKLLHVPPEVPYAPDEIRTVELLALMRTNSQDHKLHPKAAPPASTNM